MGRVQDKVILITGAGGAIGRGISRILAKDGGKVMISDFNEETARETANLILEEGGFAKSFKVDVTNEQEVKQWIDEVAKEFGGIHVLVNNAATFVFGNVEEVTDEQWDKVLSVNVKGYAFCIKHVAPYMKQTGGSIVNVASISSFVAQPAFVPYNTTKGAIIQLTRCTALDLGTYNIRVNSVCPGTIDTPATSAHAQKLGITKEELTKQTVATHFIKRLGRVDDVAYAVLFLASDESTFITGTSITVDGGYTAQ